MAINTWCSDEFMPVYIQPLYIILHALLSDIDFSIDKVQFVKTRVTKLVLKYNLMFSLKFLVICYLYLGFKQLLSLSTNSKFAKGSTGSKSLGNPHIVIMKSNPNKVKIER